MISSKGPRVISIPFVVNQVYFLISKINWGRVNPSINFYVAYFKQRATDEVPGLHSSHIWQCFQRDTFSSSQY